MPRPSRWGAPELARLQAALAQPSLFYWRGPQTRALVEAFQQHYPLRYCCPCSSGSAALHMAVASLRLQPGDEVIVPPITDMGSVIGILYQQGVPVFADLDPHTYNLDPAAVRAAITSRTRAISAVHLAGNPCDVAALRSIADEHGIALIEDCAQAWGARAGDRPVGLTGDLACYSLNDYKHISCGDGGIVATNDPTRGPSLGKWGDKSYDRVGAEHDPAALRDPADLAPNYRISEPQAAIAAAQLGRLEGIVKARHERGMLLLDRLAEAPGLSLPVVRAGDYHSFWFFLMRLDLARAQVSRDQFAAELAAEGVPAGAGYIAKPLYRYRVFQQHNFFGGHWPVRDAGYTKMDYRSVHCPVAEAILADAVLLPVNEAMSPAYIEKVARAVVATAKRRVR